MTVKKLIAIAIIYIASFAAWMILGVSNLSRTEKATNELRKEVISLYGDILVINSPLCNSKTKKIKKEFIDGKTIDTEFFEEKDFELTKSDISITINLDQRKKGNLWFPTFKALFNGSYEFKINNFKNTNDTKYYIYTILGSSNSIYNNIKLVINDNNISNIIPLIKKKEIEVIPTQEGVVKLNITYNCTGMENLTYFITPNLEGISQINNFKMLIKTDFKNYDLANNMMSPIEKKELGNGFELLWQLNNSVTGKDIGIIIPNKLNPGQIVSRVTFFAPVSLLFFIIVIFIIGIILKVNIHPMNYFFLTATFFSFHLMFSYFSDHLNIYLTFLIASVVSLFLTTTYLRLFTPKKLSYFYAPVTQFIYLIVFSYSFFFKGMTGVIVTICSVITLFILMQITAKTDWETIFTKK